MDLLRYRCKICLVWITFAAGLLMDTSGMILSPSDHGTIRMATTISGTTVMATPATEIKPPDLPPPSSRPLVIQSKDHHTEQEDVHIEYRGFDKFCTGTTWGYANTSTGIWDPVNQESKQSYYFRYVTVDMPACRWVHRSPRIVELFFTDPWMKHFARLSQPTRVSSTGFRFLIYVPPNVGTLRWKVRWTACRCVDFEDCVKVHHDDNAFRAGLYVNWRRER